MASMCVGRPLPHERVSHEQLLRMPKVLVLLSLGTGAADGICSTYEQKHSTRRHDLAAGREMLLTRLRCCGEAETP